MDWEALDADPATALDAAVAGWRVKRCAAYADLVDAVAARLPGKPPRWKATPRRSDVAVANELRAAGRPVPEILAAMTAARTRPPDDPFPAAVAAASTAALGPLLAALSRTPETGRPYLDAVELRHVAWFERIAALAARPPDPRIATALVSALRDARLTVIQEDEARRVYAPAIELVVALGDERAAVALRELLDHPVANRACVRGFLAKALPEAIDRLVSTRGRPLHDDDLARCRAVLARLVPPRARIAADVDAPALLAQVAANPADDGPRTVLADRWLERGDPRGELVALQLRGGKPGAGLLRKVDATLGDLGRVTKNRSYARGFLDRVVLCSSAVADAKVWEAAARSPLLATVRDIDKGAANESLYRMMVGSPEARSVERLVTVSKAMLVEACARPTPWPVAELVLEHALDVATLARLARSTAFPRLELLALGVTARAFDGLFRDRDWCTVRGMRVEIHGDVRALLAAHLRQRSDP